MSATSRDPLHITLLVLIVLVLAWIGLRLPDSANLPAETLGSDPVIRALDRVTAQLREIADRRRSTPASDTSAELAMGSKPGIAGSAPPPARSRIPDDAGLIRELAALRATLASLRPAVAAGRSSLPAVWPEPVARTAEIERLSQGVRSEDVAVKSRTKQDLLLRSSAEVLQTLGKPKRITIGKSGGYENWSYQAVGAGGEARYLMLRIRQGRVVGAF